MHNLKVKYRTNILRGKISKLVEVILVKFYAEN